ncbi:MAG TPA: metalloregulator ArsR/SmtB family transcription factor [Candidatus Binatia bacterium]|nr:metalloregulator ArsR/SmtB family transcription factor [Candidatus Binatia bacterium]
MRNAEQIWEAEAYQLHAELCKTLTDPKRLMILQDLRDGERSVGELAAAVGMSLPNASQHLAVMRHAGLVAARREASTVYYSLTEPRIVQACAIVHQIVLERMERRGARGSMVFKPGDADDGGVLPALPRAAPEA